MARYASKHPTELELEILKVVWREGELTVRQVRDTLAPWRDLAHNSVLTVMNIMTRKGYLRSEKQDGCHYYKAAVTERKTAGGMLRDIVDRAFGGSSLAAMESLLQSKEIGKDDLDALRQLLDRKAKRGRP